MCIKLLVDFILRDSVLMEKTANLDSKFIVLLIYLFLLFVIFICLIYSPKFELPPTESAESSDANGSRINSTFQNKRRSLILCHRCGLPVMPIKTSTNIILFCMLTIYIYLSRDTWQRIVATCQMHRNLIFHKIIL